MARKLHSPTTLTEFAPLTPEGESKSFSFLNLFKKEKEKESSFKSYEICDEKEARGISSHSCPILESKIIADDLLTNSDETTAGSTQSGNINAQSRNMSSVLEIVKNIVEGKRMGLQRYKDSDFKQYWMPDSNCKECYECGEKFSTFRRRHHCRICGQIFCRHCCCQRIPGHIIGYSGDLRVCNYCFRMVSTCMQTIDSESEFSDELCVQSFHDFQSSQLGLHQAERLLASQQNISTSSRRKSSVMGFREEDIAKAKPPKSSLDDFCHEVEKNITSSVQGASAYNDQACLSDLYLQLLLPESGVELHKNPTHPQYQYVRGCDVVKWLINNNAAASSYDAINIGQAFIRGSFLESDGPHPNHFVGADILYKLKVVRPDPKSDCSSGENHESMEPLWVKEIQNMVAFNNKDEAVGNASEVLGVNTEFQQYRPRSRIPSSSSSFYLDLDVKESTVKVSKPSDKSDSNEGNEAHDTFSQAFRQSNIASNETVLWASHLDEGIHDTFAKELLRVFDPSNHVLVIDKTSCKSAQSCYSEMRDEKGKRFSFEKLDLEYQHLETNILRQLLQNNELPSSWCGIILPMVHDVIDNVHPDVKNDADSMDIRQYVQFKKIPGGSKSECSIVSGVVFSKVVAHRKMEQNIFEPTILLLSSPISYQRTENKLSSLDPVIMQEFEYLKNTIGKLTICKPNVLLVERSVSRLAQEMLLSLGITVALNIKASVMERVARCTQAAIVSTVDAHLGKPQLGSCQQFRVQSFNLPGGKCKTLMFLDGCPSNLGCTILLRGGSTTELKKVKQIVQFMLYVAYNWHLERSFLMDEFACLPYSRMEESDDEDDDAEKIRGLTNKQDSLAETMNKEQVLIKSTSSETVSKNKLMGKRKLDDSGRRLEAKCIEDFSDPLQSYLQEDNDPVFIDNTTFEVTPLPVSNTFHKLLNDVILCCSLNVEVSLPYLETDIGRHCPLRKFFPDELYWSVHFSKESETKVLCSAQVNFDEENEQTEIQLCSKNVEILPIHPFTSYKITNISSSLEINSNLSDYRARGGTIKYICSHQSASKSKEKKFINSQNSIEKVHLKTTEASTNTGLYWERKVDALDPYNHQKLAVLFCSYSCSSNNAPNYCVNPWIVKMDFYGSNDISFGGFLEKYCFRSSYVCPSSTCDTKMTEHVRKFVHEKGCVHILLHEMNSGRLSDDHIRMWSWCHKCKQASPVVPISQETWSFSFAKYLELRFYGISYMRQTQSDLCSHSLHHDHYQYFAYKQTVAIFEYNPITVWEILLPAITIKMLEQVTSVSSVVDQIKTIAIKGSELYSNVLERLVTFKQEYVGTHCEEKILNMIEIEKFEQSAFREKIEKIQWRLTSPTLETMQEDTKDSTSKIADKEICSAMWKIEDQVHLLKYHIAEAVHLWNNRIQEFVSARKKEEKQSKIYQNKIDEIISSNSLSTNDDTSGVSSCLIGAGDVLCDCPGNKGGLLYPSKQPNKVLSNKARQRDRISIPKLLQLENKSLNMPWLERCLSCESITESVRGAHSSSQLFKAYSEPIGLSFCGDSKRVDVFEEIDVASNCSSASSYTYGVTSGIYAGLMVQETEDSETYVVCHKEEHTHCSKEHERICPGRGHERSKSEGHQMSSDSFSKTSQEQEDNSKKDKKERTVKTILSQFLSSSEATPIQSPFPPSEHIITKGEGEKIPVIVYDDEPSSIIAFTLASAEYEQQLQEMRIHITSAFTGAQRDSQTASPSMKRRQNSRQLSENLSSTESPSIADDANDFSDIVACTNQEAEKASHKSGSKLSNFHLEIQFSDSSAKFYCRVYYAEQFRKLRCLVFNEGEERFIRSLCHCIPWVARGGKSGSTFCKTQDDRFILKQMQKLELQSFLDFAPAYFQYINKAFVEQRPVLLAKIVGVYRIGYKNTVTNAASKMDLLVMENLFYGCNISRKIYDLKGSVRNRLVNTSGMQEEDIVLLDENLLKISCDNPLYIRSHSKRVLTTAIENDTQFLSGQSVMDYSLLVGLDEEKMELVVGIIDYIRTFTWDKKVEMFVKSSGILGGHGKMPTVVSPELYRMRFCEAMDAYFSWVPDRWTNLGMGGDI